jgi:hypothetical protein
MIEGLGRHRGDTKGLAPNQPQIRNLIGSVPDGFGIRLVRTMAIQYFVLNCNFVSFSLDILEGAIILEFLI